MNFFYNTVPAFGHQTASNNLCPNAGTVLSQNIHAKIKLG